MTLTKSDIVDKISEEPLLEKHNHKDLLEHVIEEIKNLLEDGQSIKLSGFGNFELRDKKPRPGRNPKTGEEVPISARRVVTFKPGHKLKKMIQNEGSSAFGESNAK